MPQTNLKKSMAIGSAWMMFFNIVNRFLGIISTMILARILVPEDYGLVAMAMSVYALIELLSAFGFDVILIQKTTTEDSDYDSAWTIRLICYSILAAIFFSLSGIIAEFYNDERLIPLVHTLSLGLILSGLANMRLVDLRRNLLFSKEFLYQVSTKLVGFVVTVPLALYYENYWALVYGQLATRLGSVVLSYCFKPCIPKFDLSKAKEIFNFSIWVLFSNILNFSSLRLPDFVLGRIIGARSVGLYSISNETGNYPVSMIAAPMNRAIFPGYSRLKNSILALKQSYLEVVGIQALIILPAGFGLSAIAKPFVSIILGDQWSDAVIPTSILAISGALAGLSSNSAYIFLVLAKPKISFIFSVLRISLLVPTVIIFAQKWGIVGAASAYILAFSLILIINYVTVANLLSINLKEFVIQLYRPVVGTILMYTLLTDKITNNFIVQLSNNSVFQLLSFTTLGGVIYITTIMILWLLAGKPKSSESYALDVAFKSLKRLRRGEQKV